MRTNDGHCEGPAGADSAMRLRCGPYTQYRSHCARFWAIVIVPVFGPWQTPTAWDREFLRQNAGKLICFNCAGQVPDSYRDKADHITGGAVCRRVRQLLGISDAD